MCAVAKTERTLTPAARMKAAVAQAIARDERSRVEPLESRVLFAAGDLDLSFGGTGKVTLDFFNRNDFGQAVAVQSDNKVLVAGWVATGTTRGNDIAVARFNVDGTLDTTFGVGGKVTTHLGSSTDTAYAVSVQGDGRIVVAGTARGTGTGNDFAVVRYNADGSLDATFGTGGITRTDLGGLQTDQMTAMTLTDDGRIVLVGSTVINGNQQLAAARYTAAGQLDGTFGGGDGIVVHPFANGAAQAKAVAMLADGSMILAGSLYDFSVIGSDFAAVRLFSDGTLDTSFGNAGWATVTMGGEAESAGAVVVQDSGKIVLVGQFSAGDEQDVALARLTAGGQLDASFGGNGTGYVVTDFAAGIDWATGALLQSDGKIVVAGHGTVNDLYQAAAARYNPDGTLDAGFGNGAGTVLVSFDGAGESFGEGGVAIDGEDRLVIGGHVTRTSGFDMAVTRLENTITPPNAAPTAHAGGAYQVNPGGVVVLDGSGSSDVDGSIGSYEWDFDYDGSSFDVDATGVGPTFSAASLAGPAVRTVALRVTDNQGAASTVATATVTINAAPAANAGGAYLVNAGGSVILDGSGSSDVDGTVASYEWDFDYDGSSFDVDGTGVAPTFSAAGLSGPAVRTVALRVVDDKGASSVVSMTTVTINAAATAHAGGEYLVNAGGSVVLDASGSSDVDGSIASYEWDLDYDGSSFDVDATGAAPTFSAVGLSGPAVRTVALRVTDDRGATSVIATATVTINAAPTAHAGGSYQVNAGGSVVLDGSGSADVDGSIASYEWDLDYDGSSFNADATGVSPTFSAAGFSGAAVRTVALRVTDNHGATSVVATALVTVNGAPVADAGGGYAVVAGESVQFNGSGSSDADGSIVAYEWDFNYDGGTFDVDAGGATPTFAAPADAGGTTRTIALRCIDDNGAASVTTTMITIHPAPPPPPPPPPPAQGPGTAVLVDDPNAPGKKMLSVMGTSGSDAVRFKVDKKKGDVEVRLGNKKLGTFSGMTRIVVDGGAGDDVIDARNATVPVVLFGGAGDDYLVGGDGHDILVGGAGDDNISGSHGNDVIVGGTGRDVVFSHFGNDLVVAGSLSFENDLVSMTAVLSEWTRTDQPLSQRVANLMNGGGKNGTTKLAGSVLDDNAADRVVGTPNADWLLTGVGDRVIRIR